MKQPSPNGSVPCHMESFCCFYAGSLRPALPMCCALLLGSGAYGHARCRGLFFRKAEANEEKKRTYSQIEKYYSLVLVSFASIHSGAEVFGSETARLRAWRRPAGFSIHEYKESCTEIRWSFLLSTDTKSVFYIWYV